MQVKDGSMSSCDLADKDFAKALKIALVPIDSYLSPCYTLLDE